MGRLGSHAVYASPGQSPARTQDSLPAVGQTLPGGLSGPLGSSERFLRCFLHRFPPFPGFPSRKRAPVRHTNGTRISEEAVSPGSEGSPRLTLRGPEDDNGPFLARPGRLAPRAPPPLTPPHSPGGAAPPTPPPRRVRAPGPAHL